MALLLTLGVWGRIRQVDQARLEALQASQASSIVLQVERRMQNLEQVLRGAAGYLGRGSLPTRAEWHAYVGSLDLATTHPGLQGLTFVEWIPPEALAAHVQRMRQEGFPDYTVAPGGPLTPLPEGTSSVIYLEPMDFRNQRAFGKDMLADSVRREAMLRARDTGQVSLSGRVTLYQETESGIQPGAVLFAPVYRQGGPVETVADRRRALRGWTTIPLRMTDFMRATLPREGELADIEIYDGPGAAPERLLFDSDPAFEAIELRARRIQALSVGGRVWTAQIDPSPAFFAQMGRTKHWEILAGGLGASLLLFILLSRLQGAGNRARQLAWQRDISRQREAAAALQESESRLRTLGDQLPGTFIYQYSRCIDGVSRFLYISEGVARLCGVKAEEVMRDANSLLGLIDPSLLPAYQEAEEASARDLSPFTMDLRVCRTDGEWRWFRVRSAPRHGPDGFVIWEGISTDVTEQKQGQALLEESEARFRALADSAPVFIWMSGPDGRCIHFNHAWAEWTGQGVDQALGSGWTTFLHPDDVHPAYDTYLRSLEARVPFTMEFRLRHRSGSYRWISDRGIPRFAADGAFLGFIGAGLDIQDRKETEAAIQGSELRARKAESLVLMAGGIAHDFNNLFQSLQGNLEVAGIRAQGNPFLTEPLNRAMGALNRAVGLSWKMLDFSGRGFMQLEPLNLETWLPAYVSTLRLEFPPAFHLHLDCGPVPVIKADRSKLEQVVKALLDNALEAATASARQIQLRLFVDFGGDRPGPESPGIWPLDRPELPATVCLEIADDGPGVAPEQLDLICDPFYSSKETGRGLGLPAAVGILTAHHAGLHVFNGEGRGLVLRLHFPPSGS